MAVVVENGLLSYFSVTPSPPLAATVTEPSVKPHCVAAEAALESAHSVVASEKRIVDCVVVVVRFGLARFRDAKKRPHKLSGRELPKLGYVVAAGQV